MLRSYGKSVNFGCQVISYKDHFVQCLFRTKETIWYNNTGVTLYNEFLYEVVPEFLRTHADESFRKRIIWTRIFTFVDHTIYWKIDYKFPNPNKLSALVELNEIKWLRCMTLMMRWLIKRCFYCPVYGKKYALFMRGFYYPIYGKLAFS